MSLFWNKYEHEWGFNFLFFHFNDKFKVYWTIWTSIVCFIPEYQSPRLKSTSDWNTPLKIICPNTRLLYHSVYYYNRQRHTTRFCFWRSATVVYYLVNASLTLVDGAHESFGNIICSCKTRICLFLSYY